MKKELHKLVEMTEKAGGYPELGAYRTRAKQNTANELPRQGAIKNDAGKLDLTLVPVEAMEAIARAMTYGANKYGRGNYRQSGMHWTRLTAACLRHIFAWLFVADIDESGNNHIDHAIASLAMLAYQMKHHPECDNRKGSKDE